MQNKFLPFLQQLTTTNSRYWNGYILIYEARDDHKTPRTPKKSFSGTSHRRSVGPGMVRGDHDQTIMVVVVIICIEFYRLFPGSTADYAVSHL